jgi:hypothetical protein
MTPRKPNLTAAQEVLLACAALDAREVGDFSEWDLTVAAWKQNPNRFGLRGYEEHHPDHKRVMSEIMGTTKKDNPIRRGWLEKVRTNFYRLTPLGRAEASRLSGVHSGVAQSGKSAQAIYDAVLPYYEHVVFRQFCRDAGEPRLWLGAASFLGLASNSSLELQDRLRHVKDTLAAADKWMEDAGSDRLVRGVTGGGASINKIDIARLRDLIGVIEDRFSRQITAIRNAA